MKLKNKVAIVTGGGRGIGKAIALAFAQEGANLVLISRTSPEIEETATQVRALGVQALAIKADVSKQEDVTQMVEQTIQEFGTVDILVNNAGIQGPIGFLVENNVEHWIDTIQINLIGQFLCIRAVLPIMMERKQGKIINLSGGGSTSARPRFSAYAASKAAVVRLTETLAEEVKDFNIQVNAIAPGAVNTRLLDEVLEYGKAAGKKEYEDALKRKQEGGTSPEIPAKLAVFLASDESNGLTGRLISAVHDDWQNMPERIPKILSSDAYTLRRIDAYTLQKINPEWSI